MKKKLYMLIILPSLLLLNCNKKDEVSKNSQCSFTVSEIKVPSTAGKAEITVKWAFAEWEISTGEKGFLSGFTYLNGGSANHSSSTRITFSYGDNVSSEEREQKITLTNKTTGEQSTVTIRQETLPPIEISVNPGETYQNVTGFGGMNNVWAAGTLSLAEVEKMYSQEGLGYNMMRIMIWPNKNDWSRDVATTLKAQSLGARILASPWTPPAEMKSSNSNLHGHLLPEKYADYVAHLNDFVAYMKNQGINIEAVSIQNEPDWSPEYDGCEWTPEQILDFIKNHAANINAKVLAAEAVNFKKMYTDPVLNDAVAVNNLDIVGGHLYGGGLQDYPLARAKGKEMWMTEHLLNEVNNGMGWDQAMVLAKELNDCMKANFNAYFWWYLKRSYSMLGDGDKGTAMGEVLKRGYVLSHYAKYATGRKRIQVGNVVNNSEVEITAYSGSADLTFIALNRGNIPVSLKINLPVVVKSGGAVITTETQNMEKKSVVLSSDKKSVTISLPVKSIVSVKLDK
ncbi:hypothetical protein [Pseudopedobacter sp.]|uniref:hypothetical protein n=1 Tax=Pseudopedobacter sp. TaxID=1936787 RepID=UPI003341C008